MPVRFTFTLVASGSYLERAWHYIVSRLVDHNSPLWFSDGLILFLLSLAFPPLLTWLAVVLWLKRRERKRFHIFRRVIAEGLARHLWDLAVPAANLIAATISARPTEELKQELSEKQSILEDFVAMRVPFFPPEELEQIGEVVQASEFVADIAWSAAVFVRDNSVAIVLHEPILAAVTKSAKGKNISQLVDKRGVAVDTLEQYLDVLDAATEAWIQTARQFVSSYTANLWNLELAELALQKISGDLRKQQNAAASHKTEKAQIPNG